MDDSRSYLESLDLEELLDHVLTFYKDNSGKLYSNKAVPEDPIFDEPINKLIIDETKKDMDEVYEILKNDGYLKIITLQDKNSETIIIDGHKITSIIITLKGKIFLKKGGYVGQAERNLKNNVLEKRNEKYLRYGAVWAAVFGGGFLIWDIVKFLVDHKNVEKGQIIAYLFLLLLSMLVYQLVRKLP